jgi:hypothetical protein
MQERTSLVNSSGLNPVANYFPWKEIGERAMIWAAEQREPIVSPILRLTRLLPCVLLTLVYPLPEFEEFLPCAGHAM